MQQIDYNTQIYNRPTGTGGSPSGNASGDLTGTYPNPIVAQAINSFALPNQIWGYLTGTNHNFNPTGLRDATVLRVSGTNAAVMTGLVGGYDGRILVIRNVNSFGNNFTLLTGVGSDVPNRFETALQVDAGDAVILQYSALLKKWTILASHYQFIEDIDMSFTDNTFGNADTDAHGFLPKLPGNGNLFLNGIGIWSTGTVNPTGTFSFLRETIMITGTSSTGTFVPMANTSYMEVELVGAGGGAGGVDGVAGNSGGAGGGGAGGYARKAYTSIAVNYPFIVGIGGAGGAGVTPAAGSSGTSTVFGTMIGYGGAGGGEMTAGSTIVGVDGGFGGAAANGNINLPGGAGGVGLTLSATVAVGGAGGNSFFVGIGRQRVTTANSVAGRGAGSGASGGVANNATDRNGANGSDGMIIIREYGLV